MHLCTRCQWAMCINADLVANTPLHMQICGMPKPKPDAITARKVRDLIDQILESRKINIPALAELIEIDSSQIYRWYNGEVTPSGRNILSFEALIPRKAYSPNEHLSEKPIATIRGLIGASPASDGIEVMEDIYSISELFSKSRWNRYCIGEMFFHRIAGDSMEPAYPDGCLVACRKPRNSLAEIPDCTPVIFQESDHKHTFKILHHRTIDKKPIVIGQPLNNSHAAHVWALRKISAYAIVLGKVDYEPDTPSLASSYLAPILRQDKKS